MSIALAVSVCKSSVWNEFESGSDTDKDMSDDSFDISFDIRFRRRRYTY